MRSMRKIIDAYRSVGERGPSATLATVVGASGPGHPLPGSRMLLIEGGHHSGLIGSDTLHHEMHEAARQVSRGGQPRVVRFSTSAPGSNMVREGVGQTIDALLEPLSGRPDDPAILILERSMSERVSFRVATVFAGETGAEFPVGARLALGETGDRMLEPASPALSAALQESIASAPAGSAPSVFPVEVDGRLVRALVETIMPPVSLVVFGGGLDTCPLAKIAHEIGWMVTVVDPDPARANKGRFSLADAVIVSRHDQVRERVPIDARTVAVVMTHSPDQDALILEALKGTPACYVGLSPRDYDAHVLLDGFTLGENQHVPAGLDINAKTAHEAAVGIMAEIIKLCGGSTC